MELHYSIIIITIVENGLNERLNLKLIKSSGIIEM